MRRSGFDSPRRLYWLTWAFSQDRGCPGGQVGRHVAVGHHWSHTRSVRTPGKRWGLPAATSGAPSTAQGFQPSQQFELKVVALPVELAERLDVEEGSAAAVRRCIRFVNDQPNSIQDSYHPKWLTDAVPELLSPKDIAIGTNRLLAERGYELVAFEDDWQARMPTPEEATLLGTLPGTAVATCTATEFTIDRPIRVTITAFIGDRNIIRYTRGDAPAIECHRSAA